jgi:hypothetical protein
VAGFIYAVLGVIYAVLIALVVIAVWEDYAAARDTVEREASELDDVFRLAHPLPDPEGRQLQELARSYAQVVVDEEWALMAQGRTSPQAWDLLDEMTFLFENVEVRTKAEQVLYGEALDRINELADARNARRGHTYRSVGCAGYRGYICCGFHLPIWLGQYPCAQADGCYVGLNHLLGALYHWRSRVSFLRRCSSWPGAFRVGAGEV